MAKQQNNDSHSTIHNNEPITTTIASSSKTTITPTIIEEDENGSLAMVILITAGSLAFSFFRLVGICVYKIISTLLLPVYYLISFCWRNMVTRPFALLMNIGHTLYPVLMYCIAAICCGTLIGGCAGFAAEAIASFTISTTWGRSSSSSSQQQQQQIRQRRSRRRQRQPFNKSMNEGGSYYDYLNEDEDYDYDSQDVDDITSTTTTAQSEISSQWDPSFFGEQQLGTKGKERIDHWRQNLLSRSSTESSTTPRALSQHQRPSSSFASMMPMSPMDKSNNNTTHQANNRNDIEDVMDDWAWDDGDGDDDDDDDAEELNESSRLRRRSVVR